MAYSAITSDADAIIKATTVAVENAAAGAVSDVTGLVQEGTKAAADVSTLVFGHSVPEEGDIGRFEVSGGNIRLRPKNWNELVFNNRHLLKRIERILIIVVLVTAAVILLVSGLSNVLSIPMQFFSSADRHDAAAAALLDTYDVTFTKARVPSWQHMFDIYPFWIGFGFTAAACLLVVLFSLNIHKPHRDNAYYDRVDAVRRAGGSSTSFAQWPADTYSRMLGIGADINLVAAYGVSIHGAYIDAVTLVLLYTLFPVFSSSQDSLAFVISIILGFTSAAMFIYNLKALGAATRASEVMPGIVFHALVVGAFMAAVGCMPYAYYNDTANWNVAGVRWGFWGFVVIIVGHFFLVYANAAIRTYKRIAKGVSSFERGARIITTPEVASPQFGDSVLSGSVGESGSRYNLDLPYDDFFVAFLLPMVASMWLIFVGLSWVISNCWILANNNVYTP